MLKGFINKLAATEKIEEIRKLMLERGFYRYNQYRVLKINKLYYFNGKMNLVRKFVSDRNTKNMLTLVSYSEALYEPHIVEMNIEGGEMRALNGMTRLLKNVHSMLLIEIHPQFKELYHNPKLVKK